MNLEETVRKLVQGGWWPPKGRNFCVSAGHRAIVSTDPDAPLSAAVWTWEGKFGAGCDQRPDAPPLCDLSLYDAETEEVEKVLWVLGIPTVGEAWRLMEDHADIVEDSSTAPDGPQPDDSVLDLATGEVMAADEALALLGNPAVTRMEAVQRRVAGYAGVVFYLEAAYWQAKEIRVRLDEGPDEVLAEAATDKGLITLAVTPGADRWNISLEGLGAKIAREWDPKFVLFAGHAEKMLVEEKNQRTPRPKNPGATFESWLKKKAQQEREDEVGKVARWVRRKMDEGEWITSESQKTSRPHGGKVLPSDERLLATWRPFLGWRHHGLDIDSIMMFEEVFNEYRRARDHYRRSLGQS